MNLLAEEAANVLAAARRAHHRARRLPHRLLGAVEARAAGHPQGARGAHCGHRGRHRPRRGARGRGSGAATQQYQAQLAEARTEAAQIRAQAQSDKVAIVEEARVEADRDSRRRRRPAPTPRSAPSAPPRSRRCAARSARWRCRWPARSWGSPSRTTPGHAPPWTGSSRTSRRRHRRATDARLLARVPHRAACVARRAPRGGGVRLPSPATCSPSRASWAARRRCARPSPTPASRRSCAPASRRSLFEGRIAATSLAVLTDVVSARWSNDADLVDGVEQLGAQAAFTVAETDGTLDRVEDELFAFGRAVDESPELQLALTDPSVPPARKGDLVRDLVGGTASPVSTALLAHAAGNLRGRRPAAAVAGARAPRVRPAPAGARRGAQRHRPRRRPAHPPRRRADAAAGPAGAASTSSSTPRSSAASSSAWATTSSTAASRPDWSRRAARSPPEHADPHHPHRRPNDP